jgi:hypothetical protein
MNRSHLPRCHENRERGLSRPDAGVRSGVASSSRRLPPAGALLALATFLALAGCGGGVGDAATEPGVTVRTVPTAAEYVSGGQVLVRIEGGADDPLVGIEVRLNGSDVTASFRTAPPDWHGRPGGALLGLVEGLVEGENRLEISREGLRLDAIEITNYPITGPIFSGEHLRPYFCLEELEPGPAGEHRVFAMGTGEVIRGGALDEHCSLPTRVDYLYRSRDADGFEPLPDRTRLPADVARMTNAEGLSIPYVVRLETGTINRAIYQTAVVVDPAEEPSPWSPPAGWNGRLVYTFGGGCEAGFFQGTSTGGVLRDNMLSRGYAVASSTLNVNAQGGCNDPLSAETAMMVKERFAEVYGVPAHTIGSGGSGGAMQQLLIAGAYPGILDGILPTATFPDAVSYMIDSIECLPLREYLNGAEVDDETKRLVGAWATWATCDRSLASRPNRVSPHDCPAAIPASERYDARTNPGGVRCSIYDGMRNVFGTRAHPEVGAPPGVEFGRSPHDNVGVQYGLEALERGLISKELFLDVNEGIGGWDIDFGWRPERAEADAEAVAIAYRTGRITSGAGGLATTPVIDERAYLDHTGDFHTSYYSFVMRERLVRDNGHAENYVIQRRPSAPGYSLADENLALMDRWLTTLALDRSGDPVAQRVVRARPPELTDLCVDGDAIRIVERQTFDEAAIFDNTAGRCNELHPPHAGPRMVAGGPLTNDVLKCQLKPLERGDYTIAFSDEEWLRLGEIFPSGVCDWSRPGEGQVAHTRTWISFGPSPVNRFAP